MIVNHFPFASDSHSADEIAGLTQYYSDQFRARLENAGEGAARIELIVPHTSIWFESALDQVNGSLICG